LKAFGGFLLTLLVIVAVVGVISYNHEMAPTWAEIAKQQADLDIAIAKANASSDIASHGQRNMAMDAGAWVAVLVALAFGIVFVWAKYDTRKESWNRTVDGSFATREINHNGRTVLLDPNKSQFGFIAYDKETGEIATDANVTGPDRQLEYANNVQRTRTVAAKQMPERQNRTTALADAGFFAAKTREADAKAKLAEMRLVNQRQSVPVVPPSRQLPMWTAKDAFIANTDTTFALGLTDDNSIVVWDVESTPHVRVHGKTQGSGKTNLIKEIATGAVLSGAHVIVLDRRGFKDWSAFQPFVELVDNRVTGAFYGTVKRIQEIYRERDGLLGGAGVGNLASLADAPKRIFLIISEFGSACRGALASGELDHVVPLLKNILSEAGATGVHLIFEDQAINRNWPPELRGNAEPITGYLPQDASKAGGYTKAFELERYQFHYDGDRFRTFDMSVEAPALLFDAPIMRDEECLIDSSAFVLPIRSVKNERNNAEMPDFSQKTENERTNERSSTDLQRMVWAWRDANPDGTQAELREEFAARRIEITRSWVHTCWHKWEGLREDEE